MRRWLCLTCLLFSLASLAAEPRRVAITVDDLPWVELARSAPAEVAARHRRLVATLARFDTHATGFVNENKLEIDGRVDAARRAMLADWLDAGLDLGNHTYDHNGLHATPIEAYEHSILRGEAVIRPLLAARGRTPSWFRHPYLQAGRDDATRERLARFLGEHGYRIAPVTIDNGEWIYASAYVGTLGAGDAALAARLRRDYVDYMLAKFAFYEDESKRLFGREIAQVLLIHANALNADALPALLERLRRRGYVFVALAEALEDPAYAHADGYRGGAGISWLHRWAMAEQMPRAFYQGEPTVAQYVLDLAGVEGE
jgi:peptidoglycan/xylan/chitin deacetylase (PgdA/CDA1 family)